LGWSKNGSFVLNEDVVIIGKWEKINYYNVEYKYEGEVPAGAPTYETKTYEEGTNVIVEGNPSVDGYTFSGWTTADADIASGNFDIYNNVVIIGKWTKNPVYYNVEYKYEGDVPADAPTYETKTYEEGTTVTVEAEPSVDGYKFLGWSKNGSFVINNNVVIIGKWEKLPGPVTEIIAPEKITIVLGEEKMLEASVNTNAVNKSLYYMSNNESVVKIDENGKITTVGAGTALITVASVENPSIYKVVEVTVTAKPAALSKHYIVFGKTEKIGWYSVSLDGGKTFFTQFGNDHLEVEKGTEIIVKANDVFGDPFTFYVNGNAVTPDENGYVRILVNDFILIGALGIPVVAPDAEESLNFIQKFIKAIKDFFAKIAAFFKF
ncbi:MAG: InlB B-repeat-containing protein, partial [Clostridia bacterium]|nr:InlB B-repeat-containing protein [Clostridia bacterium]